MGNTADVKVIRKANSVSLAMRFAENACMTWQMFVSGIAPQRDTKG